MEPAIKKNLEQAIKRDQPIRFRAYAILSSTEDALNFAIENILLKYGREDLLAPAYTVIKELAVNGVKANIKRVLFTENNINIGNDDEYDRGMEIFRRNMGENFMQRYALKSQERRLYVDIVLNYTPHRLVVEVINNAPLSLREHDRIRHKFENSLGYDDIAHYYLEGGDHEEGAGMGIVLVTMLLKAQDIDPRLFSIRSDYSSKTTAKVEFPLSDDYMTRRERYDLHADEAR